jgi:uncharacterized protein
MLFSRRQKPGYWERFKLSLWPRVSWRRSALYYLKRILRLSGSPRAIAMGAAVGAAMAFTPFLGFHLILTFLIAWPLRGNMIAGAIGTCVGNPLTYPFIWASTYELGHILLRQESHHVPVRLGEHLLHKSWDQLGPIIEPMTIGSIPLGLACGAIVYLVVYKAVSAYRESRRERLSGTRRQAPTPAE